VCAWLLVCETLTAATTLDRSRGGVDGIVRQWMAANRRDFEATPHYDYSERDKDDSGSKTYDVEMLLGTPYKRLIAVNGRPLSQDERRKHAEDFADERTRRQEESPDERADRLAEYDEDRQRARRILDELPHAFEYTRLSDRRVNGRAVHVLQAVPRTGYRPPNVASQVLTGMRGQFWIDAASGQLVRAFAHVLKPVSIVGFLVSVRPGTEFELEQMPIGDGVWLPAHFRIKSRSSILLLFHHHTYEDRTYFNYHKSRGDG
jgi:hypothetical protein